VLEPSDKTYARIAQLFIFFLFVFLSYSGIASIFALRSTGLIATYRPEALRFSVMDMGNLEAKDLCFLDEGRYQAYLVKLYHDEEILALYGNYEGLMGSIRTKFGTEARLPLDGRWFARAGSRFLSSQDISEHQSLVLDLVSFEYAGYIPVFSDLQLQPGQLVLPLETLLETRGVVSLKGEYLMVGHDRQKAFSALKDMLEETKGSLLVQGSALANFDDGTKKTVFLGLLTILIIVASNLVGVSRLWSKALLRDISVHHLCGAGAFRINTMILSRYAALSLSAFLTSTGLYALINSNRVLLAPLDFLHGAGMISMVVAISTLIYFPSELFSFRSQSLQDMVRA